MSPALSPRLPSSRLPCGTSETHLSALVDHALPAAARERLAAHVLRCRHCGTALAELRGTRDLVRRATPTAGPTPDLADRLRSIALSPDAVSQRKRRDLDLWLPAAAPRTGSGLPKVGASLAAMLVVLVGLGWFAAPAPAVAVADGYRTAAEDYAAVMADSLLSPAATAAAMAAPQDRLITTEVVPEALPIRSGTAISPAELARLLELGAQSGSVPVDGVWEVRAVSGANHIVALVSAEGGGDQGTRYLVRTRSGDVVASRFMPSAAFATTTEQISELAQEARSTAGQTVAGRSAVVVEVDGAYDSQLRWWLDVATGMVLRTESRVAGIVVSTAGFESVHLGAAPVFRSHLELPLQTTMMHNINMSSVDSLQQLGWSCPRQAGIFHLLSAQADRSLAMRVQLIYGDLTQRVLVLQEPGQLSNSPHGFEKETSGIWISNGWPTVMTWQTGDTVTTVVGTAPRAGLNGVAESLPQHKSASSDLFGRVRDGWTQIGTVIFG